MFGARIVFCRNIGKREVTDITENKYSSRKEFSFRKYVFAYVDRPETDVACGVKECEFHMQAQAAEADLQGVIGQDGAFPVRPETA